MIHASRRLVRITLPGVLILLFVLSSSACAKHPTTASYKLVWQDEFTGTAGQLPDSAKWKFDVGTNWGNNQLEYDTNRPENVSLDGAGHLAITARKEAWLGQPYTSGRINTNSLFSQSGGKFEARIRQPIGQGMWPAFWLLGSNFATAGWPGCGEIDIMEYRGQEPTILHGSLHGPGYSGGAAITKKYTAPVNLSDGFHTYTVEWSSAAIVWSIDGKEYQTITPANVPSGGSWVFDHPFFVILDLAVGGGFVGSPDATTPFPMNMLVDYVRVYRKN